MKIPTFFIGYDVESADAPGAAPVVTPTRGVTITESFLKVAGPLHRKLNVPCTLFICGKVLEQNVKAFQQTQKDFKDLFDLQQHTYSHLLLKTVVQENEQGISVVKSGTLDEIKHEVQKTNELLKKYLECNCLGLTSPYGYYRGLSDRPDILEILHKSGIRFVRSYTRNEHDWFPVSFYLQPFWYGPQGLPGILEFAGQGWQDCMWRGHHGWNRKVEYLQYVKQGIDYIVTHKLTWCYTQHDWSSIKEDPNMEMTKQIIEYARERGVRIVSYLDYYRDAKLTANGAGEAKCWPEA